MTADEQAIVERRQGAVQAILGGQTPNDTPTAPETLRQAPETAQQRARKERADKGTRRPFWLEIPGVKFNMEIEEGRTAFTAQLCGLVGSGCVASVLAAFDALLAELDKRKGE